MTDRTPQDRQCVHCEYSHLCPVARFASFSADLHDEMIREHGKNYGDDDGTVQRQVQNTIVQLVTTRYPQCALYSRAD